MRLAVYTDYVYTSDGDAVYAQRAFALFLARLAGHVEGLAIAGRLEPEPGTSHYRLPDDVDFVPLPHYASLARPLRAAPAMVRSVGRFWRLLERVDAAWLLGPYPLSYVFVALAALRRKRVFLGVRQDWPRYVESRHPRSRLLKGAARVMESTWRMLARRHPTVVVGPELARNYASARRVLPVTVSMIDERDIVPAAEAAARPWDGELRVLSVGRIETEKNPLLLADVLARLRTRDARWRLSVCGEGPLEPQLRERLRELGVEDAAELLGYVPIDRGLLDLYRGAHAFLHVSWTEGLPQVLFEAFAAGLPVVATDVGGVGDAAGDAALLVPAGDPDAAVRELERLREDAELRTRLVERGLERARAHTTEAECQRIVEFLEAPAR